MLEHHGDAGDRLADALIADHDLAGIVRQQAVDAEQQRGLAATGRADNGDDLALADIEVDVAENLERAVMLAKAANADAGLGGARRIAHGGDRRLLLCHSAASDEGLGVILAQ
jgi:hypothetical protein